MAELKTKETDASVDRFVDAIADAKQREDSRALVKLMRRACKEPAKMWGTRIVGFGSYHYKYASGHEGDTCKVGFSPRKQALTLYLTGGLDAQAASLKKLGKFKTGKGCLYIKTLDDVDLKVLEAMVARSASIKK